MSSIPWTLGTVAVAGLALWWLAAGRRARRGRAAASVSHRIAESIMAGAPVPAPVPEVPSLYWAPAEPLEREVDALAFVNRLIATLQIELTEEATPIAPNLRNVAASATAQVPALSLDAEIIDDDDWRPPTEEELTQIVFRGPRLYLKGKAGVVVPHDAVSGGAFTVRDILAAVAETERLTRWRSGWSGGVLGDHVHFEGLHLEASGAWCIHWGS